MCIGTFWCSTKKNPASSVLIRTMAHRSFATSLRGSLLANHAA
jgi:hypothetical protein